MVRGLEVRESTKSTKQGVAERLLLQRHRELAAGTLTTEDAPLVRQLLDDLVQDYVINGKSSQWCKLIRDVHLNTFFGHLRADQVTTRVINQYISARRAKDIKNATINRELGLLHRAFTLAATADPPLVKSVPRISKLAEHNVRKGFFTQETFQRLLPHLPAHVRPIALFAYHTGCRRGEILKLQWRHVNLTDGIVRLEPGETKNRDGRTIPLTTELRETLASLKTTSTTPYVFTYLGKPIRTITTAWNNACKASGFTDENGRHTLLFHDLRRSAIRNLVRAGVPERVATTISGPAMFGRICRHRMRPEPAPAISAARI